MQGARGIRVRTDMATTEDPLCSFFKRIVVWQSAAVEPWMPFPGIDEWILCGEAWGAEGKVFCRRRRVLVCGS